MDSLEMFLREFPDSTHPFDRKRSIKYALDAARAEKDLNEEAFRKAGVSEENISLYLEVYSWIRDIQEMLDQGEI